MAGPRPGSTHYGSRMRMIQDMQVGEYVYVETTAKDYSNIMRATSTKARTPWLQEREYTCKLYRGVGSAVDDIVILVRIERLV